MHFFAVSLASSLIALGGAVPTLNERSTDFCPGQSYLTSDIKCSSGFLGCVAYEKASEVCNGPKRFNNDCSVGPELGSFFNCANGFKGCTTNSGICDNKSQLQNPENCNPGSVWYVCPSSGFTGCSDDPHVCDSPTPEPKPEPKACHKGTACSTPPTSDCTVSIPTPIKSTSCETPSTTITTTVEPSKPCSTTTPPPCSTVTPVPRPQKSCEETKDCPEKEPKACPNPQKPCESNPTQGHCTENCPDSNTTSPPTKGQDKGTYYVCANGFRGYSTNPHVCDSGSSSEPCPAGSAFYVCAANGFRGCSANPTVCDNVTEKDPISTPKCPKGTWYVQPDECSSGFVGCTALDFGRFETLCKEEKQFWGSCPSGHGNYYNCANGFVGCTTNVGVCDK